MTLARAKAAHEDHVVRVLGERYVGKRHRKLAIHRRGAEVEAREITMRRKRRRIHLMAHRAHCTIDCLGSEQLLA